MAVIGLGYGGTIIFLVLSVSIYFNIYFIYLFTWLQWVIIEDL